MALHAEETQTCPHLIAHSCCGRGWQHCLMKNCLYSSFFFLHVQIKPFSYTQVDDGLNAHSLDATRLLSSRLSPHDNLETGWFWESRTLTNWGKSQKTSSQGRSPFISTAAGVMLTLQVSYCDSQKFPYTHTQILLSQAIWVNSLVPPPHAPPRLLNCQLCGVSSLCRLSRATWTEERVNT